MTRSPSYCGVILAAGESSRMGRDKALLPWPPDKSGQPRDGTFLSAAINTLERHSELVLVVVGKNADNLAPLVYSSSASLVVNPAPERGQFSSMQIGLKAVLNHGRDTAILTLVDRPPARDATIEKLKTAFVLSPSSTWMVVPQYGDKHGHPVIIGREMIEVFLRAPVTSTAREIEHANQNHIEYVTVDDPHVIMNVDTPDDYARLQVPC